MRGRGTSRLACALSIALATTAEAGSAFTLQTRLRETFALEFDHARVEKIETEVQPRLEIMLPADFELTAIVRTRFDAMDRIEPGRPNQSTYWPASRRLLLGEDGEIELREFYVERAFKRAYLTLGKQQVVWGKADGIKLLDVVDPQSYREFILPPFDESRIPLWTMNLEVPVGPVTAQLLWIPDPTVHDLPESGAAFELTSNVLVPETPEDIPVTVEEPDRPDDFFGDSDGGVRLSGSASGWDFTLNYLYHYDDTPVLLRHAEVEEAGLTATVTPTYERTHVAGLSFANAHGDFTLRGEAGAFTDRFVPTNNFFDADGLVHSEEYSYLLGLDWLGLGAGTFVSIQIYQSFMPQLSGAAIRGEIQSVATLLLRKEFADGAGLAQAMLLQDPDHGDGLARTRVSYELHNGVGLAGGVDVFYGQGLGLFGEFGQRDRLVLEMEYTL